MNVARKSKQHRRILSVTVHRDVDEQPDLSWLGEYGTVAQPTSIDRLEREDMGRNEFRYFTPALTGEQTGNPDSPEQDYQRMEAYNRGDWCMVGVWAEAEVVITGDVIQHIRSGGIWGVESDNDSLYFACLEEEQKRELSSELRALGFNEGAIKAAMKSVKHAY